MAKTHRLADHATRPNIRMVDTLRVGRVFLAGDAAHCHPPAGGQGLNSSIQDSVSQLASFIEHVLTSTVAQFNLAWKLALVHKGIAKAPLLDTYGEERLPVIAQMLNKTTDLLKYTFSDSNGAATHWSTEAEIRKDMNQLGVSYRGSSLVYYEPTDGDPVFLKGIGYNRESETDALPGDRAPEAPGLFRLGESDITTSLFNIFLPSHHTVLVFSERNTAVAALEHIANALQSQPSNTIQGVLLVSTQDQEIVVNPHVGFDLNLIDGEGHAFKGYRVQHQPVVSGQQTPLVVIVRPDGVIGARFRGPEGVVRYFNCIFNGPPTH